MAGVASYLEGLLVSVTKTAVPAIGNNKAPLHFQAIDYASQTDRVFWRLVLPSLSQCSVVQADGWLDLGNRCEPLTAFKW